MWFENTRLRVTGPRLPEPKVWPVDARAVTGDVVSWSRSGDPEDLPLEVATRELTDVDLSQARETAEFLGQFGAPSREVRASMVVPLDELVAVQCAARHLLGDRDAWAVWTSAGTEFAAEIDLAADDPDGAFLTVVNHGLRVVGPRIERSSDTSPVALALPVALCVQLYNAVADAAAWKVCENESCQRVFMRQRGRSGHGQLRTSGVVFCSAGCNRAQQQRRYRRRKAQERAR